MATDAAHRRPQLPALSYLDIDQGKMDEDSYKSRSNGAPQSYSRASAASPLYGEPLGPPPPYAHTVSQHLNSRISARSESYVSESRRLSGEESDGAKQKPQQSLPSISEALGVEGQTSYTPSTSAIQAPSSPSPNVRRTYGMEQPQFSNAYGNSSASQYRSFRQDSAGPQTYSTSDASKTTYPSLSESRSESRPPLNLQTSDFSRSERLDRQSFQRPASPAYEQPSSHTAGSMGPPPYTYGYTPYPPRYAEPAPAPSNSVGPIYQPSAQHAPPPHTPQPAWKSENGSSRFESDARAINSGSYGDSIKRHLDHYDFEAALNDVSQTSSMVLDFSRRYGDRMHQTARTGPSLSSLPSTVEVEDMISKSRLQLDSLNKIREVIVTQQVAYEQQVADQRQQAKAFRDPPAQSPADVHEQEEDSKGGFAGSETKKRRGRAAPPGRCHSCNRAETPEWRRGPDGARTLCNACGLHYAKLTRKQTNASKTANVASSNLRPKEM